MVQRRHDDVAAGSREVAGAAAVHGQVEAVVAQQRGQPVGRRLAVGGDDDAVAAGEQLGEPGDEPRPVADDRTPPRCLHDRRVR